MHCAHCGKDLTRTPARATSAAGALLCKPLRPGEGSDCHKLVVLHQHATPCSACKIMVRVEA